MPELKTRLATDTTNGIRTSHQPVGYWLLAISDTEEENTLKAICLKHYHILQETYSKPQYLTLEESWPIINAYTVTNANLRQASGRIRA